MKRRINIAYLAVIPIVYLLVTMSSRLSTTSTLFYGFAENKETEINHDQPVSVAKIFVTPGQPVHADYLLMEVQQELFDYKIKDVEADLQQIDVTSALVRTDINNQIELLRSRKTAKINEIEGEIRAIETKMLLHNKLMEDLTTIQHGQTNKDQSPMISEIERLRVSIIDISKPIDIEIAQLTEKIKNVGRPVSVTKQKYQGEMERYKNELKKFKIRAPSDGVVGNILCKEGEYFPAFSTFINFYEPNPSIVKGYVHERLKLDIVIGDSVLVSSTMHPSRSSAGVVVGLGSRIVEIPERLRKIPEIKTYGREVLIKISTNNQLLQKEKVRLEISSGNMANSKGPWLTILEEIGLYKYRSASNNNANL